MPPLPCTGCLVTAGRSPGEQAAADLPTPATLLDQLDAAREAATAGRWKLWGMDVMADQDGTSNVDTATPVAHTSYRDENGKPRTFDAHLICDMHAALPLLTAALRAVLDLADGYDTGVLDEDMVAARLRAAVAAALTPEGAQQ